MLAKRIMASVIGGVLCALAGVAAASNLSSQHQDDFLSRGTHQFYVWCSGTPDYVATAEGANAEDAQMKLYNAAKASGKSACWPVWQGRVAG